MNLCIVQSSTSSITETFIQAHIDLIPADVTAIHAKPARIRSKPILSNSIWARSYRVLRRKRDAVTDTEIAYEKVFQTSRPDAVLAEYGPSGVYVMDVCRRMHIPLIVHFHGFDAYRTDVLRKYARSYQALFEHAGAVVAVSRVMRDHLISLGAPEEKVFCNPCGVNCKQFTRTDPSTAPPVLLAVGRFVQKKAPHLLLLAFARVHREHPNTELRMIGDGPLLGVCRDLASALNIEDAVHFLGAQPHHVVRDEMLQARAFVQHSVVADNGDSEGTPVSVIEAGAGGLPVVSTRHAGIPDVVLHGETGLLVEERDVEGMATEIGRLVENPDLAAELGSAAHDRVLTYFQMERSIGRLTSIIECSVTGDGCPPLDYFTDGPHVEGTAPAYT